MNKTLSVTEFAQIADYAEAIKIDGLLTEIDWYDDTILETEIQLIDLSKNDIVLHEDGLIMAGQTSLELLFTENQSEIIKNYLD